MKVLVFHGYTQSGPFFQRKTLRLQKHLQKAFPGTAFVFPTAPVQLKPSDLTDGRHEKVLSGDSDVGALPDILQRSSPGDDVENYAWFKLHHTQEPPDGLLQSLNMLADVLKKEGPFDGVIGFSQGSALAGLIASLLEGPARREAFKRHLALYPTSFPYPEPFKNLKHPPLKFGVTYGTYMGLGKTYSAFYEDPLIETPFCHFQGLYDPVVGTEMREAVKNARIGSNRCYRIVHPGAHIVPLDLPYMDAVVDLIRGGELQDSTLRLPLSATTIEDSQLPSRHELNQHPTNLPFSTASELYSSMKTDNALTWSGSLSDLKRNLLPKMPVSSSVSACTTASSTFTSIFTRKPVSETSLSTRRSTKKQRRKFKTLFGTSRVGSIVCSREPCHTMTSVFYVTLTISHDAMSCSRSPK